MKLYDLPRIVSVRKEKNANSFVVLEFDAYRDFIMKMSFEDGIDEELYLKDNPDVAKAVEDGRIPNANYHFRGAGYVEGRKFRPKAKRGAAASSGE